MASKSTRGGGGGISLVELTEGNTVIRGALKVRSAPNVIGVRQWTDR